mmetsp:Transcript_9815/g.18807  ORF Transcript_9815/g.18807 Transcript_9815/m.18807 type:complete len:139 (-) Transcript_9815:224-640(-)|eukprot:scaffold34638_cov161-Amphora_coffeaeformis.AAC.22
MPRRTKTNKRKASSSVEQVAEIDHVRDERFRKGKNNEYLVSWTEGAEPQWVNGDELEGSLALQEWEYAATNMGEEQHDTHQVMEESINNSKRGSPNPNGQSFCWGQGFRHPCFRRFGVTEDFRRENRHSRRRILVAPM